MDTPEDERGAFAEHPSPAPEKPGRRNAAKPHFHGHRDRLRQRFVEGGEAALADYEILEMVLYHSIRQRDTKPIAKALLQRFGSLAAVFSAPAQRPREVDNVGEKTAIDLKLISAAAGHMLKREISGREVLSSWTQLIDYCTATMAHESRESLRILFLDKKNALIADEVQQTGTVDHTPVYPREIVRRALELSATAIILVHNHPSGDPTPSRADVEMTKTIIETAKPLGVLVHDHIIIGRSGHASFKGLQLI